MKATLEFDLPEEIEEFKMATRGADYFCSLWDLKQLLRERHKYGLDTDIFEQRFKDILNDTLLDDIS